MEEAINYEEVPGTWAKVLKDNWLAFNAVVRSMDDSDGKVPHEAWRQYILWDMQRRHDEEMKNEKDAVLGDSKGNTEKRRRLE